MDFNEFIKKINDKYKPSIVNIRYKNYEVGDSHKIIVTLEATKLFGTISLYGDTLIEILEKSNTKENQCY